MSAIVSFAQTDALKKDQSTLTKNTSTEKIIPNSKADNEDERYRIGFQDSLEIQVFKHPDLNQKVSLSPDGTISLFRASKPIAAVCKTEQELANIIEQEYLSFLKKPEVNVFVSDKRSQSFGVIGAVEKAGTYFVNRRIRLLELLSFAGGPNKEAGSRMIVARTGSTSACKDDNFAKNNDDDLILMSFKVKDVLEAKQNLWMQPGDIVSVLDSDIIYIYGNVKKVGSVKMKEPITLTQAIVSAEGLNPTAKSKVKVLRQIEGSSERKELSFDLKDIEKRKTPDPFLEPNDIVAVSEDSTKVILRGITKTIQQGIPSLIYKVP
ncbi:MAG: polysaccharide biosynthesis/export family protein [Actinomycetota bacterium]